MTLAHDRTTARRRSHRDGRRSLCAAEGVLVDQLATALLARAQGHPVVSGNGTLQAVIDDAGGELFRAAQMR